MDFFNELLKSIVKLGNIVVSEGSMLTKPEKKMMDDYKNGKLDEVKVVTAKKKR